MAVAVTHADAADGTFSTEGATKWNKNHTVTGLGTAATANIGDFAAAAHTHTGGTLENTLTDAEKAALHSAVTISDTASVNLSLTGQALSADVIFGTTTGTVADGKVLADHQALTTSAHGGIATAAQGTKADNNALMSTDSNMLTGWVNRAATMAITCSSGSFTLAITGTIPIWIKGVKYTKTNDTITVTGLSANAKYFVYYNDAGTLVADTGAGWSIKNGVGLTVIVYYQHSPNFAVFYEERHGLRDLQWHNWAHDTVGPRLEGANSFAITSMTTTAISLQSGIYYDEDIEETIGAQTTCRMVYRAAGGATTILEVTPATKAVKDDGAGTPKVYWDSNGTLTAHTGATARWYNYYVYAVNAGGVSAGANTPIYCVMGQAIYTSLALAQAATEPAFATDLPTAEFKLLYINHFTQAAAGYTLASTSDKRFTSTVSGGSFGAAITATGTSYAPIAPETSANVQAALENRPNYNVLGALSTGLAKITTGTGLFSAAAAADVTGYAITGFTSGAGALDGNDSILQAINKLDGNVGTKLTNSMATNKLLGRGTAATGAIEEITLGTNLSLSGTTLNATGGGGGLNIALMPGSFNLIGAAAEPILQGNDGTNFDYPSLEFIDGATEWNAFFTIPSKRTAQYGGSANIKIDIDFALVDAAISVGDTITFGVGLKEVLASSSIDVAPPTETGATDGTVTGYAKAMWTADASTATLDKYTITATITADSSISSGELWVGRLHRRISINGTNTDTSGGTARVLGITVYE